MEKRLSKYDLQKDYESITPEENAFFGGKLTTIFRHREAILYFRDKKDQENHDRQMIDEFKKSRNIPDSIFFNKLIMKDRLKQCIWRDKYMSLTEKHDLGIEIDKIETGET